MISLIAAVGKGNELGFKNGLIWHLPEDLKYFSEVTKGHTVLMGHKTFSSLPRLLPGRRHIVLTREPDAVLEEVELKASSGARPEVVPITELFEFVDKYKGIEDELFVIGGGSIYKQLISEADKIYLTEIEAEYPEADVYFPEFSRKDFSREVIRKGRDKNHDLDYAFVVYTRK